MTFAVHFYWEFRLELKHNIVSIVFHSILNRIYLIQIRSFGKKWSQRKIKDNQTKILPKLRNKAFRRVKSFEKTKKKTSIGGVSKRRIDSEEKEQDMGEDMFSIGVKTKEKRSGMQFGYFLTVLRLLLCKNLSKCFYFCGHSYFFLFFFWFEEFFQKKGSAKN